MYKYLRNGLDNSYGISDLQDKLLELMVYIDGFCSKHGIEYCLAYGSALGAERHKGFIPWDDDIDILMTIEEYSRFKKAFLADGDQDSYYLQEWGKVNVHGTELVTIAKVRMNHTELNEKTFAGWDIHQGLYVDIFIINNAPDTHFGQLIQFAWAESVLVKGLSMRGYHPKNLRDAILLKIARLFPRKWLVSKGLKEVYRYTGKTSKYLSDFLGTTSFTRAVYPAEVMFPAKYADFEQVRLKVPANNDAYLRIQFGDSYMTPPAEKDRLRNQHAAYWDIDAPGKNVPDHSYQDEWKLV